MERESFWRVLEVLRLKTNDQQGISIKEIQSYLFNHYNMERSRHTILKDLAAYENLGFDIRQESISHNQYIYKFVDREFTFDEVRVLVDSICINQFLTWTQKKEIIDKFGSIVSLRDVNRLKSTIKINDCIDPNINLLDNIKLLHMSLSEQCYIDFRYGKYNEKKKFELKSKGYQVIPKEILYKQGRYYLIALDVNSQLAIKYYRIDRMVDIHLGMPHHNEEQIDMKHFDITTFDMFSGDKVEMVKMRVDKELIDLMIERFGIEVSLRPDLEQADKVIVHQKMGISIGLIRWLLQQGSKIQVLEPEHLRKKLKEELERMIGYYEDVL